MTSRVFLVAAALTATVAPINVRAELQSPSPHAQCDGTKAQFAVGGRYSPRLARRARAAAHARTVRILRPGEIYTMEFDETRLNLELDANGKVISVKCG